MKDIIYFIIQIILCVEFVGLAICAVKCVREDEEKKWNNGYCECGGHWVYEQAIGHYNSTSYLYRCDECEKTINIWKYRVPEVQNEIN